MRRSVAFGLNIAIGVQAFSPSGIIRPQHKHRHKPLDCRDAVRPSYLAGGVCTLGVVSTLRRSRTRLPCAPSSDSGASEDSDTQRVGVDMPTMEKNGQEVEAVEEEKAKPSPPKKKRASVRYRHFHRLSCCMSQPQRSGASPCAHPLLVMTLYLRLQDSRGKDTCVFGVTSGIASIAESDPVCLVEGL